MTKIQLGASCESMCELLVLIEIPLVSWVRGVFRHPVNGTDAPIKISEISVILHPTPVMGVRHFESPQRFVAEI